MDILYLTWGETPWISGIFRNLIEPQLKDIDNGKDIKLHWIIGYPIVNGGLRNINRYVRKKRDFKLRLKNTNIILTFQGLFISSRRFYQLPKRWIHKNRIKLIEKYITKNEISVIWCRSYYSAIIAYEIIKKNKNLRMIFDPRSNFPEEGVIKKKYRINSSDYIEWKSIEKQLYEKSDRIVVLSDSYKKYLTNVENISSEKITTIYVGVDNSNLVKSEKQYNLVYLGDTKSGWQDINLVLKLFSLLSNDLNHLIITNNEPAGINSIIEEKYIGLKNKVDIKSANSTSEVYNLLSKCSYGVIPFKYKLTKPDEIMAKCMVGTKVAEYLAAGLPVIFNEKIQDISELNEKYNFGISFNENYNNIFDRIKNEVKSDNIKRAFEDNFNKEKSTCKYIDIINQLGRKCH